jgi:hypothetical protein
MSLIEWSWDISWVTRWPERANLRTKVELEDWDYGGLAEAADYSEFDNWEVLLCSCIINDQFNLLTNPISRLAPL